MTDYDLDPIELPPGVVVDAAALELDHEPLGSSQIVEGSPTVGTHVLDARDDCEIGIWEITEGTSTDTEIDEVFIVLSGRATVHGLAPDPVELAVGSVVRLTAGMQTTWIVHETLRKIYIA